MPAVLKLYPFFVHTQDGWLILFEAHLFFLFFFLWFRISERLRKPTRESFHHAEAALPL